MVLEAILLLVVLVRPLFPLCHLIHQTSLRDLLVVVYCLMGGEVWRVWRRIGELGVGLGGERVGGIGVLLHEET